MEFAKVGVKKYLYFSFLSLLAALGNMGVVYTINRVIGDYVNNMPVITNRYLYYFAGSVILFIATRWFVSTRIIGFTQTLLQKTRIEVMKLVLKSTFDVVNKNKSQIYSALTTDSNNIVAASISLVDIITNVIVVIICFLYMGLLSWKLLLCILLLVLFTLVIYYFCAKRAQHFFKMAMSKNDRFVKYLNEMLRGFKEISIAPEKGEDLSQRNINHTIKDATILNKKAQVIFLNNRVIGQIAFYVFIGLTMLWLGEMFSVQRAVLVNFVFLTLYSWGPIESVVLLFPNLLQAKTSMTRISDIIKQIEAGRPDRYQEIGLQPFVKLEMKDIDFAYEAGENPNDIRHFSIGPVDFQVYANDIIFICGANGSGKTTFINILVGLIRQDNGSVRVNGKTISREHLKSYRSLFAPLFSDFHLFEELYGIPLINQEKSSEYLKLFEIDDKVSIIDGGFSTIDISTGQRKRLAFINAMLEGKPILILDEFAADQDPYFKRKFYHEIIPYLKKEGFTLIAITHDDHYYHAADKVYKMDGGRIFELVSPAISIF
jgi:cyclic peptide transporter